jgi:hypothetical protein
VPDGAAQETQRGSLLCQEASHSTLLRANSIQSPPSHMKSQDLIILLPMYSLQINLLSWDFHTKIMYAFPISPMHVTCYGLSLTVLITPRDLRFTVTSMRMSVLWDVAQRSLADTDRRQRSLLSPSSGWWVKLWSFSMSNFLHPHIPAFLLTTLLQIREPVVIYWVTHCFEVDPTLDLIINLACIYFFWSKNLKTSKDCFNRGKSLTEQSGMFLLFIRHKMRILYFNFSERLQLYFSVEEDEEFHTRK